MEGENSAAAGDRFFFYTRKWDPLFKIEKKITFKKSNLIRKRNDIWNFTFFFSIELRILCSMDI